MWKEVFSCELIVIFIIVTNLEPCETGLRILGGRDALKDEFPFAVRLEIQTIKNKKDKVDVSYFRYCTGAAVTPVWILTAAHCRDDNVLRFRYINIRNVTLVARYNSYFPQHLGKLAYIVRIVAHPVFSLSYLTPIFKYDIALYQSTEMRVARYARISAIDYAALIGNEAIVLGFGGTNATPTEKPLQVLKGMLIKCLGKDPDLVGRLCLIPQCGLNATICGGDSGGPVIHASGVIGVNSMSVGSCDEHSHNIVPAVSASVISIVSPVLDWISNVISNKTMIGL